MLLAVDITIERIGTLAFELGFTLDATVTLLVEQQLPSFRRLDLEARAVCFFGTAHTPLREERLVVHLAVIAVIVRDKVLPR